MKCFITLLVSLFVHQMAHAGSTVCSNKDLYYSDVKKDFGTPPPPNTETGRTVIVFKGQVLIDETTVAGLGGFAPPPYDLQFGNEQLIQMTGNTRVGSKISTISVTLYAVDKNNPSKTTLVGEGAQNVLCKADWSYAL